MNDLQKPEYVLQHNAFSQGIYSFGTNARRLVAMAMSLIPMDAKDPKDYRVRFSVTDFLNTLGIERGTRTNELIISAVRECLDSHIEIFMPNGNWKGWTWFTESDLEFELNYPDRGIPEIESVPMARDGAELSGWNWIVMKFNPDLGDAIRQFKRAYAKIDLLDLGKLQSKYAIRFYELAMSYAGFAGKEKNHRGEWYFEMSLADLRQRFAIAKSKYKVTGNFRTFIIDQPIEEINAANIGIRIKPEYARRGRRLMGVRFNCRWVSREEPMPVNPETESGKEDEAIISAFPDEYQALYETAYKKISGESLFRESTSFTEGAAMGVAVEELKKRYPEFGQKKAPQKTA